MNGQNTPVLHLYFGEYSGVSLPVGESLPVRPVAELLPGSTLAILFRQEERG